MIPESGNTCKYDEQEPEHGLGIKMILIRSGYIRRRLESHYIPGQKHNAPGLTDIMVHQPHHIPHKTTGCKRHPQPVGYDIKKFVYHIEDDQIQYKVSAAVLYGHIVKTLYTHVTEKSHNQQIGFRNEHPQYFIFTSVPDRYCIRNGGFY